MRNYFIIALMLFSLSIAAQTNFVKGYIIKNNGDIQNGYIDYRTDIENNKHCFFKPDSLSKAKEYLPGQIKGYRIDDSKYYITKTFKKGMGKETLFLECIISGRVSIYLYDHGDNEIYFAEKDGSLTQMNNGQISYMNAQGVQYIEHTNQYKGVLRYYFKDCPEIAQQVNQTGFNKESLIHIAQEYQEHVCKDQDCIVYEKGFKKKRKFNYGVEIGKADTKINFASKIIYGEKTYPIFFFDGWTYEQPSINFFTQTILDENRHYIFRMNAGINYFRFETTNPPYTSMIKNVIPQNQRDLLYFFDKISYRFLSLDVKPEIIERFCVSKNNRPFIFLGVPIGCIVSNSGYAQYNEMEIPFTTNSFNSDALSKSYRWSWGLNGGIGIEKNLNEKITGYINSQLMLIDGGDGVIDIWGVGLTMGSYF